MDVEKEVAAHYGGIDALDRALAVVQRGGGNPESFAPAQLNGADELHVGGPAATSRVAARAGIDAGTRVLDIGSGMGGVARHLAGELGATVHGLDLTPEFVAAARELTRRTGLDSAVTFSQGSALAMPFDDSSFDAAVMIHAGMNIPDKDTVFAEAARVVRPGGVLAVYDLMLVGGELELYPMPWASTADTSFVQPPLAYSDALTRAGWDVDQEAKPLAEGIAFVERALASGAPIGVAATEFSNLLQAFRSGVLAPVEIYAHLPG